MQCMLMLAHVILKLIAKDSQQWQGSFANWEEAERQLEANELAWAPPGTFAAALSTFQAALQEAAHTTEQLKQVGPLHTTCYKTQAQHASLTVCMCACELSFKYFHMWHSQQASFAFPRCSHAMHKCSFAMRRAVGEPTSGSQAGRSTACCQHVSSRAAGA